MTPSQRREWPYKISSILGVIVSNAEIFNQQLASVCASNNVPEDVVRKILALEISHQNLHGWGARPALQRDINEIIDAALQAGAATR